MHSSISYHYYKTNAGTLKITLEDAQISRAVFVQEDVQQSELFDGSLSYKMQGTPFQIQVWQAALQIPAGSIATYHDIARAIGKPKAYRAVANALGQNKIAYFIPCHRVIRKDGNLGGYRWGIEIKKMLLQSEGVAL